MPLGLHPVIPRTLIPCVLGLGICLDGRAQRAPLTVIARDYAFQVPDTLPAGPATLVLANRGTVRHEMVLIRLREGRTLSDALAAKTPEAQEAVADAAIAVLFAEPGHDSLGRIEVDLTAGRRYVLLCSLRDAPDKPPHIALGMAGSFYVR